MNINITLTNVDSKQQKTVVFDTDTNKIVSHQSDNSLPTYQTPLQYRDVPVYKTFHMTDGSYQKKWVRNEFVIGEFWFNIPNEGSDKSDWDFGMSRVNHQKSTPLDTLTVEGDNIVIWVTDQDDPELDDKVKMAIPPIFVKA